MDLFDSHCHLQDERCLPDLPGILSRAKSGGVCRMMCCGTSPKDWALVEHLSKQHESILPSFGVHPWFVDNLPSDWLDQLRSFLQRVPSASVGEIGLDSAIKDIDKDLQEKVFTDQIRLAKQLNLPIAIHCRKAWDSLPAILKAQGSLPAGGLVHSYSGSAELVPVVERLGLSLSFSGTITRHRNKRGRAAIERVSEDRLLIETDSPDMPPAGASSEINEPANVRLVLQSVSEIRGWSEEKTANITTRNAGGVFGGGGES